VRGRFAWEESGNRDSVLMTFLEFAASSTRLVVVVVARGDYELVRVDLQRDAGPGQAFGEKVCQTGLHPDEERGPVHRHDLGLGEGCELRLSRRHGAPEARRHAAAADPVKLGA